MKPWKMSLDDKQVFFGREFAGEFSFELRSLLFFIGNLAKLGPWKFKDYPPKLKIEQKSSLRKGKTPSKPPWLGGSMGGVLFESTIPGVCSFNGL